MERHCEINFMRSAVGCNNIIIALMLLSMLIPSGGGGGGWRAEQMWGNLLF